MMQTHQARWITVSVFAPLIDMTADQVYRAIRQRQFPWRYVKLGRQIRIDAMDVGIYTEPQNTEAQPPSVIKEAA